MAAMARRQGVLMTSVCPGYVRTAMTAPRGPVSVEIAAGFETRIEELAEHFGSPTIMGRMLLPNERITRHREQRVVVLGTQRLDVHHLPGEGRLQ
ncbi:MAG: hypothetical protein EBR51_00820 [Gammaproteobacteria bacterium]|nr:hypothetical protein [Gammaproteobacteria bacterium]